VQIVETRGGATTSTTQFVWTSRNRREARNAAGAVVSKYFSLGQTSAGSNYFFTKDHLGSTRDVTDKTGTVQAEYEYDPYGRETELLNAIAPDFRFAGYYFHQSSAFSCTLYRTYSAAFGRWLSRDPLEESAGSNLYTYVSNQPTNQFDPLGLVACPTKPPKGGKKPPLPPPWFPDCDNETCCTDNFDKCTTECDYRYRGARNRECHDCCSKRNIDCHSTVRQGNTYLGARWQSCFDDYNSTFAPAD
jgi:RHS repeat-associated protein